MTLVSQILQTMKALILALILITVVAYAETTAYPPAGNVPTPINTGSSSQIKQGGLGLNSLSVFGGSYFQGSVVFESIKSCSKLGTTSDGTLICNNTYAWSVGGWSSCSASCGGGTQTREVSCKRDDGVVVAESFCTQPKPAQSQSCNTQACPISCTPQIRLNGRLDDDCGYHGQQFYVTTNQGSGEIYRDGGSINVSNSSVVVSQIRTTGGQVVWQGSFNPTTNYTELWNYACDNGNYAQIKYQCVAN